MENVMIDIETMGRTPGCPVISIGAVYFEMDGSIGDRFYSSMGFNGLTIGEIDSETALWWSTQSDAAKLSLVSGNATPCDVANEFCSFIGEDVKVWGNGSIFDISILDKWFEMLGMQSPWKFWNVRDVRTVVDIMKINPKEFIFNGIKHNALDDAIHQVKYMTSKF